MKWLQQNRSFSYKVQDIPGSHNTITDALLHNPVPFEGPNDSVEHL